MTIYKRSRVVTFIALRHASAVPKLHGRADEDRALHPQSVDEMERVRRFFERLGLYPVLAFTTVARRTQETGSTIAPQAHQIILQHGYPARPDADDDIVMTVDGYTREMRDKLNGVPAPCWRDILSTSHAGFARAWIDVLYKEVCGELQDRENGDTVLAVGHGPSMWVALDRGVFGRTYRAYPCAGYVMRVRISRRGKKILSRIPIDLE